MFNAARTIALSVMIGLGALVATPAAQASDVSVRGGVFIGGGHSGPGFGLYIGPDVYGHSRYRDRRWDRRHDRRWDRHDRRWHRGFCKPRRAVRKARRMGLRHAHVAYRNRRVIGVSGYKRGHPRMFVFANVHRCPRVR